ncbi:MAG TPA: hypothetical protein VJC13_01040 [Candidatus Paceibacterota bacterium]|nr:hypothetical protein [uncultured archaeon]
MTESPNDEPLNLGGWLSPPRPPTLPDGSTAPLGVLHAQAEAQKPATLESPLTGAPNPTELSPVSPLAAAQPQGPLGGVDTTERVFKVDQRVFDYMDVLVERERDVLLKKRLERAKFWGLDSAVSNDQVTASLQGLLDLGDITREQFNTMVGFQMPPAQSETPVLDDVDSTKIPAVSVSDDSVPVPKSTNTSFETDLEDQRLILSAHDAIDLRDYDTAIEKVRQMSFIVRSEESERIAMDLIDAGEIEEAKRFARLVEDKEAQNRIVEYIKQKGQDRFIVPEELVTYLESLVKNDVKGDIGPKILLEAIQKDGVSRQEVMKTLDDAFYHSHILDREEYESAVGILGLIPKEASVNYKEYGEAEAERLKGLRDKAKTATADINGTGVVGVGRAGEAPKSPEDIELESARSKYAEELIKWKNKNRENKYKFGKLLSNLKQSARNVASDLGFEKRMPETAKSPELLEAEREYIKAKKKKSENILNNNIHSPVGGPDAHGVIDVVQVNREDLMKRVEEERELLQDAVDATRPPLERSIIGKVFQGYAKMGPKTKIVVTSGLLGVGGFFFGSVGVAGATAYAGYRAVRAGAGAFLGQVAGRSLGKKFEKSNKKSHEEVLEEYISGINEGNYEERERKLMEAFEGEENREKRQRLYKALAVAGVAGVTNIGLSLGQAHFAPDTQDLGIASSVRAKLGISPDVPHPTAESPKTSLSGPNRPPESVVGKLAQRPGVSVGSQGAPLETLKPKLENSPTPNVPPTSPTASAAETIVTIPKASATSGTEAVQVELTSKGFLQDIHNLKAEIIKKYGGKIPADIKANIMDKSSVNIAKEYGLYVPKDGTSAMGFKGEHLGIDDHGHLVYDHAGKSDVMFDESAQHVKTYTDVGGKKMFVPKPHVDHVVPEPTPAGPDTFVPNPNKHVFDVDFDKTDKIVSAHPGGDIFNKEAIFSPKSSIDQPLTHILYNGKSLDVQMVDEATGHASKTLLYGGTRIAEFEPSPTGAGEIPVLHKPFFEHGATGGVQNAEVRAAYGKMFDDYSRGLKNTKTVPFDDGRLSIISGLGKNSDGLSIRLHGEEIAKGILEKGGPKLEMVHSLRPNWLMRKLLTDNVYESALKEAKKVIQTIPAGK